MEKIEWVIGTIIAAAGVIVAIKHYCLNKNENKPKIIIEHKLREENKNIEKEEVFSKYNSKFEHNKTGGGFPCIRYKQNKISYLKIKNNSDVPITKLNLKIKIELKKSVIYKFFIFKKDVDKYSDIKNIKIKKYDSITIKEEINYIPPENEITIDLFRYNGQFVEYDIVVEKMKSKESNPMKKTVIDTVRHELLEKLEDTNDIRKICGCEEFSDRVENIEYKSLKDDRIYFFN